MKEMKIRLNLKCLSPTHPHECKMHFATIPLVSSNKSGHPGVNYTTA